MRTEVTMKDPAIEALLLETIAGGQIPPVYP